MDTDPIDDLDDLDDLDEEIEDIEILASETPAEEVSAGSLTELEALSTAEVIEAEGEISPVELALLDRERRLAGEDEETSSQIEDPDDDSEKIEIRKRRAGEFLCLSCFLITPRTRLADPRAKLCNLCV